MKKSYAKPTFVFRDKLANVSAVAAPVSPNDQASNSAPSDDVTTA